MQEGLQKIILSKSKTFLAFCFCFMAGSAFASLRSATADKAVYVYAALFTLSFFAIIFWNKKLIRFFLFTIFFLLLGVWRFAVTIPDCTNSHNLCYYNGKKVTLIGTVASEPDARIGEARYTIAAEQVIQSEASRGVKGKVLVTTRLYPAYAYGDRLELDCVLRAPKNRDDGTFRYDKYLAKEGIQATCNYPKSVSVIATVILSETKNPLQPANGSSTNVKGFLRREPQDRLFASAQDDNHHIGRAIMKQILALKSKVATQINRLWPEPESSFMAGLLYGSKAGLPPELMDNFSKTGVTHIIAVSGFNVTIIATMLMSLLIFMGLWRQQAFWAVVAVLFLFVIFTGATASVVRAATMGIVVLAGQYLGRLSRMGNVLVFTAAIMTLINPYVLLWDPGFQLSFLATLGLVYVSPVLTVILTRRMAGKNPLKYVLEKTDVKGSFVTLRSTQDDSNPLLASLWASLISTLSAILATLPLILYQFGRLSLVAPLVNILILWIIPWLMLFGFAATVLSFIFFPLGQLIAWFAALGLKYVILVVEWFGGRSWSAVDLRVPWWGMVGMYVVLFIVIARSEERATKQSPR